MDNRSNIITPRYISPSNLILRAPKYIKKLGRPEISARFLRAFKAVKILTCIPDEIDLKTYYYAGSGCSKKEACIREVLFKHSKTCTTRDNRGFGRDYCTQDYYNYKKYQDRLACRFFERQIAWNKYVLRFFSKDHQHWKDFLTKRSVHNLFVDFSLSSEESFKSFSLDFSSLARHLTILKGLGFLNIHISRSGCKGPTLKILKFLNKICPLMCPEMKIRLVMSFECEPEISDSSYWYFQILGSLPNILSRISHLKISLTYIGEVQFKAFADFTRLLSRLRSFELDFDQRAHFRFNAIKYLFDILAVNGNLQTLKISSPMRRGSQTGPVTKTIDLTKYKNFLSRLKVFSIHLPTLPSRNLNMKPFLSQHIKADQVEIIRTIKYEDGFLFFISKFKPDTTDSSVFAEFKDHTLFVDIKHLQVKDKTLDRTRKYDFERVNTSIDGKSRLERGLFHLTERRFHRGLSDLAKARIFWFIFKIDFCPSEHCYSLINRALGYTAGRLQMLEIRYEGHERFWEEDDQYTISNINYLDWEENRINNKIYKEYIYGKYVCKEEFEEESEEDYTEEMIQISYLENRNRPTERKNQRKIFVE